MFNAARYALTFLVLFFIALVHYIMCGIELQVDSVASFNAHHLQTHWMKGPVIYVSSHEEATKKCSCVIQVLFKILNVHADKLNVFF